MAKRRNYSADFKAKLALESVAGDATVAEHLGNRSSGKTIAVPMVGAASRIA